MENTSPAPLTILFRQAIAGLTNLMKHTHFIVRMRGQFLGTITVETDDFDIAEESARAEIASRLDFSLVEDILPNTSLEMHRLAVIKPLKK